jgi:tetratricopeptide (TPR) repeat protein
MKRSIQLSALLAGAALFAILPASNLSALPQSDDARLTSSGAHVNPQVQEHLLRGDALAAEGRYGAARREYRAAAELTRAQGKLPAKALRRIANSYYFEDRYQAAGKTLEQLAKEAATFGDLGVQVWAIADAAWIAGIAGDKIDMEHRLQRLHRLLGSPYLPNRLREEVRSKRLTAVEANRALSLVPELPQ